MLTERAGSYILGHSEREMERLQRQGEIFAEATEDVFCRAGIRPGMRVLDVGCGVGDVSLLVGRMVGPTGLVHGIDRTGSAVDMARHRAEAAGLSHLRFEVSDIGRLPERADYDAVVGRFILLHLGDPAETVKRLAAQLRPGGVLASVEMDIESATAVPELPLFRQAVRWIIELYRRTGVEPDMGSRLWATYRAAGLEPRMTGTCRVEGGAGAVVYDYLAESLRTLAPAMITLGIASADEIGLDSFVDRLRADAITGGHCFLLPRIVGAWVRV
ncbi:MAG: methyltransferase domain-containing protein [Alphaproteobacteria bacterium]